MYSIKLNKLMPVGDVDIQTTGGYRYKVTSTRLLLLQCYILPKFTELLLNILFPVKNSQQHSQVRQRLFVIKL